MVYVRYLILISIIVLTFVMFGVSRRSGMKAKAVTKLMFVAIAVCILSVLTFPNFADRIALRLGISNGSNMLFFFTSYYVFLLTGVTYIEMRGLKERINSLVSEIAITNRMMEK
jgi:hypothetical protein